MYKLISMSLTIASMHDKLLWKDLKQTHYNAAANDPKKYSVRLFMSFNENLISILCILFLDTPTTYTMLIPDSLQNNQVRISFFFSSSVVKIFTSFWAIYWMKWCLKYFFIRFRLITFMILHINASSFIICINS